MNDLITNLSLGFSVAFTLQKQDNDFAG